MKNLLLLASAALLASCGGDKPADAQKTADAITGTDKVAAADNPQCRMFTQADIAAFAGEPVEAGKTGAGGMGCYWLASDSSGVVTVTVAPVENHVETDAAPGYRPLPDVGTKGFVAGAGANWTAGTIANDKALIAGIDAAGGTEARTIDLLKAIMAKAKG